MPPPLELDPLMLPDPLPDPEDDPDHNVDEPLDLLPEDPLPLGPLPEADADAEPEPDPLTDSDPDPCCRACPGLSSFDASAWSQASRRRQMMA